MTASHRRALAVLSIALWAAWAVAAWLDASGDVPPLHTVAKTFLLAMAAIITMSLVMLVLLTPLIECARVYREIGRRECPTCRGDNVVPLRRRV